jgi:hypothetical protein
MFRLFLIILYLHKGRKRNACRILVGTLEGKIWPEYRCRWEGNIKTSLKWEGGVDSSGLG